MSDRIVHLVDDDEAIRRSAGFMLKTSGFQVKTYASGVELLKDARELAPGCILMDVRMPDLDGIAATARLRSSAADSPVLVLTTFGEDEVLWGAIEAGAMSAMARKLEQERGQAYPASRT